METVQRKEHWENIYCTKQENEVSWFQQYPKTSMDFVELFSLKKDSKIIDIGGGDSHFADSLLEAEYTNITVLDISAKAIERAKIRIGEKAAGVKWIVSDVTEFVPTQQYDFWHDRAAFHFLTEEAQADKYVEIANKGIAENGILVLGTFSVNGPKKCSGLEIKQYSETSMSAKFEKYFKRVKCITEDHQTPFNTIQNFLFCSFKKESK
ncbi:MAG TPA: class I SAM-dependent methyltransferase [Bacteroidia bacterium]|jgi:trans-aconitate methyltransferase|nr:class I SAM-dependent methyltransferase [Bacteroidia bacterium]